MADADRMFLNFKNLIELSPRLLDAPTSQSVSIPANRNTTLTHCARLFYHSIALSDRISGVFAFGLAITAIGACSQRDGHAEIAIEQAGQLSNRNTFKFENRTRSALHQGVLGNPTEASP